MSRPAATDTLERTGKRERILRAAVEVFAESGYFNSKVSAIAKAAGVADGTIYLYFSGKEDLLVTIFRDQMNAFLMLLDQELSKESDPAGRLRKLVEVHLRASGQDRDLAIVFQVELRHTLKFMSLFSHEALADYLQLIRALIEQGQREGSFRAEIHPQLATKAIFGILDEMVTSWVLSKKAYRLEQNAGAVADLILRGLS